MEGRNLLTEEKKKNQLTKTDAKWEKIWRNKQTNKKYNPRKPPNLELLKNLDDQKLTPDPDGALVNST